MAQNATPTTTVHAQDADADTNEVADPTNDLDAFRANVSEGDYLAVVYRTASNAGSLQRVMGHVQAVDGYENAAGVQITVTVEDGTGDGPTGDVDATAALFLNEDGNYRFDDGRTSAAVESSDVPPGGFGVEKWAWTPADDY